MKPPTVEAEAAVDQDGAESAAQTSAARLALYLRGGGIVVPALTAAIAFLVAGLVVLVTGHNPVTTYEAVFNGTGLNWVFPWISDSSRQTAALNLQQTLITTTPLILVGLAVALAFRAGLFNIGGQGQYQVGAIVAVWVGSSMHGFPAVPHIVVVIACASLAGAAWAGIAGVLKASAGANEVISTIMLDWIAVWLGVWLFGLGGPLQNADTPSLPVSSDVVPSVHLPVFWGNPDLQGLHIGIFIAIAMLFVFWALLNRSVSGYEMRAIGFNPDAARYGGMNVAWTYVKVMAICGLFAGLAGGLDILGWQFRIAANDVQTSQIGFLGIAVALLGRNTARGTFAAALLFGALLAGTSQRNLDPTVFDPQLAANLTYIIEGLIVLLVSTDMIALKLLRGGRSLIPTRRRVPRAEAEA